MRHAVPMVENNIVIQWRSFRTRPKEMNDQFSGFWNHGKLSLIKAAQMKIEPKAEQVSRRLVELQTETEEVSEVVI
jgi:hypothetical protein